MTGTTSSKNQQQQDFVIHSPVKNCNIPTFSAIAEELKTSNSFGAKNDSVTVTHFSENRGGVVEKISVPKPNEISNISVNDESSKSILKVENNLRSELNGTNISSVHSNPFIECQEVLTSTIITTSANTPPIIKMSTNPFHNSFNDSNEQHHDESSTSLASNNPFKIEVIQSSPDTTLAIIDENGISNGKTTTSVLLSINSDENHVTFIDTSNPPATKDKNENHLTDEIKVKFTV